MKILIDGLCEFYSENVRLIKTLMKRESKEEYPVLLKWKLQVLYFNGYDWIEICRIDNYLHEGQIGSHIHMFNRQVKKEDIDYYEADKKIKWISRRIIRKHFKQDISFGDD